MIDQPITETTKTLGNRLSELLREFGITDPIHSISGGPKWLSVTTFALDDKGWKWAAGDGRVVMHTRTLDLHRGPDQ